MNIAIISAFRNSTSYIARYCDQMEGFKKGLAERGDTLTLVLGYGDSSDGTGEVLYEECCYRLPSLLVGVGHGGHHYGSIVHAERFKQLAFVGNRLWESIPKTADVVGLVESDLVWSPESLLSLTDGLHDDFMVAPMVYDLKGAFYDTWAFRTGGKHFRNQKPYHKALAEPGDVLEMDSVGSVFFIKGGLAQMLYWPEEDVVVGLCRQFRSMGGTIHLHKKIGVYHP